MSRAVRSAIVGAGLMGFWHARALTAAGAHVGLIVDQDLDRAQRLARLYAGSAVTRSLDAVAEHGIQVVHICTPTPTHTELVRTSLASRCHVLVEKPLVEDVATTRDLLDVASSADLLLCPVHQVLFQRGVRQTLPKLADLQPRHVEVVLCSAGADRVGGNPDELVAEILPHPLSFLVRALPETAAAGPWTVGRPGAGELRAQLVHARQSVSIVISAHGRPTANFARVIGERGTAHFDFFHGFAFIQHPAVSRQRKMTQPFRYAAQLGAGATINLAWRAARRHGAYPGLWELVSTFYDRVTNPGPPPIAPAETMQVAVTRDILLESWRRGA